MRIVLLASPDDGAIAWEEQLGRREGRFVLGPEGSVVYRHPDDDCEWPAGVSVAQFRAAAEAWNGYSAAVAGLPESKQATVIERLRGQLSHIGALALARESFWSAVLEQAAAGML
jgi:hypothetical protein